MQGNSISEGSSVIWKQKIERKSIWYWWFSLRLPMILDIRIKKLIEKNTIWSDSLHINNKYIITLLSYQRILWKYPLFWRRLMKKLENFVMMNMFHSRVQYHTRYGKPEDSRRNIRTRGTEHKNMAIPNPINCYEYITKSFNTTRDYHFVDKIILI